jgi:hypothetical protein
VIVEAVDGVAERRWLHVVRESWFAVKNTWMFARRGLDPVRLAGNHVIVETAGTYTLYAHLPRASSSSPEASGSAPARCWDVSATLGTRPPRTCIST